MSSSQGRKQCKDPKTVRVYVIDNASSCENLLQSFRSRYTFEMSYIGLDCEWVDKKGQVNAPVALLQIATPLFDCFLVRLCKMDGQMPKAVKQILEDSAILKFGVGIQNDAKRLSEMFGIQVRGCVDLRHIITKRTQLESGDKLSCQKLSLAALAKKILGVTLDKSWRIQCSNWEDEKLSTQQIEYAMNDALVASHIFLRLIKEEQSTDLDDPSPGERNFNFRGVCHAYEDEDTSQSFSITSKCQPDNNGTDVTLKQSGENVDFCLTGQAAAACYYGHHDICPNSQMCEEPFQDLASGAEYCKTSVDLSKYESGDMEGYLLREEVIQLMSLPSSTQRADSLCQGVIDLTFQGGKKKVHLDGKDSNPDSPEKSHKSYKNVPITGSALCTNCILTAPDGSKLTTTSLKRAKWYIAKELGHLTNDDPYTVQLNFEPAGRPGTDDYCLTFKHNKCVVCGSDETYNMTKKVVPYDYRCHFPPAMKEHNSHDVLPTCPTCNSLAYFHDNKLRKKLAIKFNAPLESASMPRLVEDTRLRKVKSAAKALSNKIPEDIRQKLSLVVQKHFSASVLTAEMISQAAAMETFKENPNFVSHGLEVVKRVSAEGKLMEFQKMWRKHFVNTMHPKFLPPLWSVDHRHEILKGKIHSDAGRWRTPVFALLFVFSSILLVSWVLHIYGYCFPLDVM